MEPNVDPILPEPPPLERRTIDDVLDHLEAGLRPEMRAEDPAVQRVELQRQLDEVIEAITEIRAREWREGFTEHIANAAPRLREPAEVLESRADHAIEGMNRIARGLRAGHVGLRAANAELLGIIEGLRDRQRRARDLLQNAFNVDIGAID